MNTCATKAEKYKEEQEKERERKGPKYVPDIDSKSFLPFDRIIYLNKAHCAGCPLYLPTIYYRF